MKLIIDIPNDVYKRMKDNKDYDYCALTYAIDNGEKITESEWKVIGIGINTQKNIWHVVCPKCNCDMFTEFTSYCPNCGEPKKEINIAELDMRER